MSISSFGYFAAIIIPVNYLLVITAYPPALVIQERYLKNKCARCKCPSKDAENKTSRVELFFEKYWTNWIRKARFVVVPVILLWMGFCLWRASMM